MDRRKFIQNGSLAGLSIAAMATGCNNTNKSVEINSSNKDYNYEKDDFPINEITVPDIGIKINTKIVSFTLIVNMAIMVNRIVSGSFTISSKIDKKELCTSLTSPAILEMVSPFLFSEKKANGKSSVFLYMAFRMSFKIPFLRKVIKNKAK